VNKTCLQCGSILPSGVRACSFCDSQFVADSSAASPAHQTRGNLTLERDADPVWRSEVAQRVACYRARRRKSSGHDDQPDLPFEQPTQTPSQFPSIALTESPAERVPRHDTVVTASAPSPEEDFSFTIAIGRTANRRSNDDAQMFIDVSLPVGQSPSAAAPPQSLAVSPLESEQHAGLYPVASMEERRVCGFIDAVCLLFACGGFLTLFGSLGGHFALSKLSFAVYALSFAIVYLQYFSLFTVFGGTTPGMMLRGVRVVDFSGEDPSPRQLLLRAAGYMLSAGTFFLGFLWSQWDEDELTWHDRISRTYLSSAPSIADSELTGAAHTH
jgi:uncharacterized RDD family membrane protein YckC